MLDLELRLGEGTGAALALPFVEAAARVLAEMATFDQAGVTGKGWKAPGWRPRGMTTAGANPSLGCVTS